MAPRERGRRSLPYFIQALALDLAGYSVFSARLPAALFSVLSCAALAWLARELRLQWPAVAVVLLMALPLQWRYALEGRPYSQAMFFAILATVLAVRLARKPGALRTALYGLALVAGMYTLPLLVLFPLAHFVWVSLCLDEPQRRRVQVRIGIAGAAAVLLLAPWVIWANSRWAGAIAGNQGHFLLHPRLFLVLLHELPGGGYTASILLLGAAGAGLASRGIARSTKVLLALLVAVPLVGTLAIDAIFDYFFAVRQLIPVLPALALLAAEGLRDLYSRRRALGTILFAALSGDVCRGRLPVVLASQGELATGGSLLEDRFPEPVHPVCPFQIRWTSTPSSNRISARATAPSRDSLALGAA